MAARMTRTLGDVNPVLVCIMNGGMVPFGKLLPRLQFPLQVDYVHVTRYRERLKGGDLHWLQGPHLAVRGRAVVLVDDILDEGTTLAAIEDRFRKEGAEAVYKAVLIVKNRVRAHDVEVEFAGLEVPNRYVFGYGMDYKGYLRNAPGIYAERESP
jgi:hypoxanthine phosphoribosyltransferase